MHTIGGGRSLMISLIVGLATVVGFTQPVAAQNKPGTVLSVLASTDDAGLCEITIGAQVTSTAAADAAVVTATVTDASQNVTDVLVGTIAAGNVTDGGGWTMTKNIKTASVASEAIELGVGTYSVQVCAEQHGADGRTTKRGCSSAEVTFAACGEPSESCDNLGGCVSACQLACVATDQPCRNACQCSCKAQLGCEVPQNCSPAP